MTRDAKFLESDKLDLQERTETPHNSLNNGEEKFDKDHFSLRSQINNVERKLKSEIQHRTSILAKAQQSELFNIREVLRADRKKMSKITEIAENTHRATQFDINKLQQQIKKEKNQDTARLNKIQQDSVKLNFDIENKVSCINYKKISPRRYGFAYG